MERRILSEEEKKISEKQIKKFEEDLEHFSWLKEYNDLMLNKGLYMNYKAKVKEFKSIKDEIVGDIKMVGEKIKVLKEHIEKGVEVRKPSGVG